MALIFHRALTLFKEKKIVLFHISSFAMADFDAQQAQVHAQAHQNQVDHAQARIAYLEQSVANMANALHQIQIDPPPVPPPKFHPNLNLSPPPPFSGSPLHLPTFKMKLVHFLVGNRHTYPDAESQLLYAGQLLEGPAYQWYLIPAGSAIRPDHSLPGFRL